MPSTLQESDESKMKADYCASWMASIHFSRISCVLATKIQRSCWHFFGTSWITNYTKAQKACRFSTQKPRISQQMPKD